MSNLVVIDNGKVITDTLTVAEVFGKRHADVIRAVENLECSDEFNERNFALVKYRDKKGENRPKYNITRDGFTFLVMGFTGKDAAKFKEDYIRAFNLMEEELKKRNNTPLLPQSYKEALIALLEKVEENEKLEAEKQILIAENKHKENVIVGLVEDIPLAEKRQILNQVMRKSGGAYADRWSILYKQFEMKFHCNINKRMEKYNSENKPKVKNKLDFVDKVMGQIDGLYDIACKLFQNDVEKLVNELYGSNVRLELE
jgi:Rha family phage regulatory protein